MELKEFIQLLKVLADETRIRIVHLLTHQELTVTDLCVVLEMSQSAVSKHLVKLRLFGVVSDERNGNFVYYSLNEEYEQYITIINLLMEKFEASEVALKDLETVRQINKEE